MDRTFTRIFSKEFEVFLSLTETRSFKQTAECFGVSISTISRQLSELEQLLDVTLFDRSCRPMVLTAEGRWFLNESRPSLERLGQVVTEIRQLSNLKPNLRIGFIDSFSYDVAPSFISHMQPHLQGISCLTGGADRLIERLNAQEVDVILTINPCFDIPNLKRHLLLQEPSVLIFPNEPLYADACNWSWKDISVCGLPFIHNYCFSGGGKLEDLHFNTHDVHIVSTIHTDSIGMRTKLVAQGHGWAIIRPLSLLKHTELLPHLRVVRAPAPGFNRNVYVLARSNISQELFTRIISTLHDILKHEVLPRLTDLIPCDTGTVIINPAPENN